MERKDDPTELKLPVAVISKADLVRLSQELDSLDEKQTQAKLTNAKTTDLPVSKGLEELAVANNLDLLKSEVRKSVKQVLAGLQTSAPIMHISFATAPSGDFLQKITAWFRQEIHPQTLLQVGMQPSIAAGCTLRTTNKYFDLSLRRFLQANTGNLGKELRGQPSGRQ